jgi:hypothetical protein
MVLCHYLPNVYFSQHEMFWRLAEREPSGSNNFYIKSVNIIAEAGKYGLLAGWGRASPDRDEMRRQVTYFVNKRRIPLIACQRYANHQSEIGHFRIIIKAGRTGVTLYDPCTKNGGPDQQWSWETLLDFWRQTGPKGDPDVAVTVGWLFGSARLRHV